MYKLVGLKNGKKPNVKKWVVYNIKWESKKLKKIITPNILYAMKA
jgi:hypothetical protein